MIVHLCGYSNRLKVIRTSIKSHCLEFGTDWELYDLVRDRVDGVHTRSESFGVFTPRKDDTTFGFVDDRATHEEHREHKN